MNDQQKISKAILAKATERGPEKTTCPSEVARELFPDNWRSQMQTVRDVAFNLQKEGKIKITQKGQEVDIAAVKGPIRIKQA